MTKTLKSLLRTRPIRPTNTAGAAEIRRLDRLRESRQDVGSIILVNTPIVLKKAAGTRHIPDRAAMRKLYEQLRGLDDGLSSIEDVGLLDPDLWPGTSTDDVGN